MDPKHRKLLLKHRLAFTSDLQAIDITGFLLQDQILTENDVERIKAEKTRLERTELLLDTLPRKGKQAYSAFHRALIGAEYRHLAKLIPQEGSPSPALIDCVDGPVSKVVTANLDPDMYPMKNSPRGWCLIINNVTFLDYTLSDRLGSDVDCVKLEKLFRNMDFSTWVVHNATASVMVNACKALSEERCSSKCDCVIVCVLSHGSLEGICGVDGDIVTIDQLLDPLTSNLVLKDTPKIFVIQSCRADRGATISGSQMSKDKDISVAEADQLVGVVRNSGKFQSKEKPTTYTLYSPLNSSLANRQRHLLLAFCAFPGSVAYRNTDNGSWYIEALVEIFSKYASSQSVLDMLTLVNQQLSSRLSSSSELVQIPAPLFTLEKKLILNPSHS